MVKTPSKDGVSPGAKAARQATASTSAVSAPRTRIEIFKLQADGPDLHTAPSDRLWMDNSFDRAAYRCMPMTIANSALIFRGPFGQASHPPFVNAHFGNGILTFQVGHLFRTQPGWGLWVRGLPNHVKHGIQALDGIVETDWLPFPFTMNWLFTQPGTVFFDAGEPICFVTPIHYGQLEDIEVTISTLDKDPELQEQFRQYHESRERFNRGLALRSPEAMAQKWQKHYTRGTAPGGATSTPLHKTKMKFPEPKILY
jgi:Family of unknown function (DUF6065)